MIKKNVLYGLISLLLLSVILLIVYLDRLKKLERQSLVNWDSVDFVIVTTRPYKYDPNDGHLLSADPQYYMLQNQDLEHFQALLNEFTGSRPVFWGGVVEPIMWKVRSYGYTETNEPCFFHTIEVLGGRGMGGLNNPTPGYFDKQIANHDSFMSAFKTKGEEIAEEQANEYILDYKKFKERHQRFWKK